MKRNIKEIMHNGQNYIFNAESMDLFEVQSQEEKAKYIQEDTIAIESANTQTDIMGKVVFNVSNQCNLRCAYCYANGGDYGRPKRLMTSTSFDRCITELHRRGIKKIGIVSFFGGEPTMNFSIIEYGIEQITRQFVVANIEIVTNGTLLTRNQLSYLKDKEVQLTVSIDGPEMITDKLRGNGVFQRAMSTVMMCQDLGYGRLFISATYTKLHQELGYSYKDICSFFEDIGVRFSVSSVISSNPNLTFNNEMSREEICDDISESLQHIVDGNNKTSINPYVYAVLLSLIFKAKSIGFCDDVDLRHSVSFDYNGDIYNCFRFWGQQGYKTTGWRNNEYVIRNNDKNNKDVCKNCWARNMCKVCIAAVVQGEYQAPYVHGDKCIDREIYEIVIRFILDIVKRGDGGKLGDMFAERFLQYNLLED